MNTKALFLFGVIAIAFIIAVFAIGINYSTGNTNNQNTVTSALQNTQMRSVQNNTNATVQQKILFSSTQYAPYSYLIYPGVISQQAKAALAGFNLSTSILKNGSINVTITIKNISQKQSMIIKSGDNLYIVETTFGDDGYNNDYSLGDDGFIIVNSSGYVI